MVVSKSVKFIDRILVSPQIYLARYPRATRYDLSNRPGSPRGPIEQTSYTLNKMVIQRRSRREAAARNDWHSAHQRAYNIGVNPISIVSRR